jgi:hypothetical protein
MTATAPAQRPVALYSTEEGIAEFLPVSTESNVSQKWLLRLWAPTFTVSPGDVVRVDARSRVTSEYLHAVGVGSHLHVYDVDGGGAAGPWQRISPYAGDNVWRALAGGPNRHHMPVSCSGVWVVPDTWPAGHRPAFVYLGDAHSTMAKTGHKIAVDHGYGHMTAEHWATV